MSVAIITGASSGIGADFARELAPFVDELWFVARRKERMEELGREIGKKYKVICADLCEKSGIEEIRRALSKEIENMTSLNVSGVALTVKSLALKADYKNKNKDFESV